jgi:CRP-like cAMP-binding protein
VTGHTNGTEGNLLLPWDHADRSVFERVPLTQGDALIRVGEQTTHAYFPVEGVISLVGGTTGGDTVEVAAVGREGVAGAFGVLGNRPSPYNLIVQVPGTAMRVHRSVLADVVERSQPMRDRTWTFFHGLVAEITQSAVCNRYHMGDRRLARWLLTIADRAQSATIPITHEFAALMIGGVRPRVTTMMHRLRRAGSIRYGRGEVTIVNRQALEDAACNCYALIAGLK